MIVLSHTHEFLGYYLLFCINISEVLTCLMRVVQIFSGVLTWAPTPSLGTTVLTSLCLLPLSVSLCLSPLLPPRQWRFVGQKINKKWDFIYFI